MTDDVVIGKVYDAQLMARLLGYLRPYRRWVVGSVCLLILHSLLGVSGPYLTKVVIDRYLRPQPLGASLLDPWLPADHTAGLQAVAMIYLAVLACGFLFRSVQIYVMNYTGQRVIYDLRIQIFRHLQQMGVRFYDRNAVGRLVTRVTNDVDVLNDMFTSGVVAIAGDLITLVFILGVMIHLSPSLTLALFCVGPLVLLVSIWFRKKARESYRRVRVAVAQINAFLQEQFTGVAVVQLFNHESRSRMQFDELNEEHREAQRKAIRAYAFFFPTIEWLGILAVSVLLVYGGGLVARGALTIGIVVAFLQYGTRVFRPLQNLSEKYNVLQAAMASSERIFKLLDTPYDEPWDAADVQPARAEPQAAAQPLAEGLTTAPAVAPEAAGLRVEFRNVWFAYRDDDWVLRDVTLTIEPGEMLAIVGHTGAGKTTLTSLLLRFHDVQQGSILVGGRDVREWPIHDLRRQFGIVLQDPYLFSGTIESNIRLGNNEIPHERIEQVSDEVNLSGFLRSLPLGLQQPIRERGTSLSFGQKQLIGFARALAHNPRFLVLDEATSSVDTETEFKIQEALSRMVAGHTSIVIAHRLSTVQRADRILVMHKGRVREVGTHQQLLAERGIYWKLYQLQYREQEGEAFSVPGTTSQDRQPAAPAAVAEQGVEPQTTSVSPEKSRGEVEEPEALGVGLAAPSNEHAATDDATADDAAADDTTTDDATTDDLAMPSLLPSRVPAPSDGEPDTAEPPKTRSTLAKVEMAPVPSEQSALDLEQNGGLPAKRIAKAKASAEGTPEEAGRTRSKKSRRGKKGRKGRGGHR